MKLEILVIANEVYIPYFHKQNKLSSKLLHFKLGSDRSHTFWCFIFFVFVFLAAHVCMCVCAIITSSGGKEQQSTSVPSALTVAASFLHLFGTLYCIILFIFGSISRVGIIGSIGSIGSIKQSK